MIIAHADDKGIFVLGHAVIGDPVEIVSIAVMQHHSVHAIICAAVSSCTLTLAEGLEKVAKLPIDARIESGSVRIAWNEQNDIGKALVDTWLIGMVKIRDNYGGVVII